MTEPDATHPPVDVEWTAVSELRDAANAMLDDVRRGFSDDSLEVQRAGLMNAMAKVADEFGLGLLCEAIEAAASEFQVPS